MRTSREFFGKYARPTGYTADGREVVMRINSAERTGFVVGFKDVWHADGESASGVWLRKRQTTAEAIDSIEQVHELLRSGYFQAGDSTTIGCQVYGWLYGDSATAAGSWVALVPELVDSSTGTVVQQLDSVVLSATLDSQSVALEPTLDLLSGTYYVRMRIVSANLPSDTLSYDSRYPIIEWSEWVDHNEGFGKLRKEATTGGATARVNAQPNPFTGITEIRFSIPEGDRVSLTVYTQTGQEVMRPVDRQWMEPGRYAVQVDATGLPAGTYVVVLKTTEEHVVEKLVLQR
jgi:hypothetical protein